MIFFRVCVALLYGNIWSHLFTYGESVTLKTFGDPCTCDSDCDFGKWLTCQNSFCACTDPSALVFDHSKETCVVRLRHKCFDIINVYKSPVGSIHEDLPPFIRCIDGAFCSISAGGLCVCNSYGFFEVTNDGLSSCAPKRSYGEECKSSIECSSDICSASGTCDCKPGEYFEPRKSKCAAYAGSFCFTTDDCTPNALCDDSMAKCVCNHKSGYRETEQKHCELRLSFGDLCNATSPCNDPQLACVDSACVCKHSKYSVRLTKGIIPDSQSFSSPKNKSASV